MVKKVVKGKTPKLTQRTSTGYTPAKWERAFLSVLSQHANVTEACQGAGVDRSTPYLRRNTHPDFKALWDAAIENAVDLLEREAWRRASEGVKKGVYYKDQRIDEEVTYSDALMTLLLKAHRPNKFKDRSDVTSNDKPLQPVINLNYVPAREIGEDKDKS